MSSFIITKAANNNKDYVKIPTFFLTTIPLAQVSPAVTDWRELVVPWIPTMRKSFRYNFASAILTNKLINNNTAARWKKTQTIIVPITRNREYVGYFVCVRTRHARGHVQNAKHILQHHTSQIVKVKKVYSLTACLSIYLSVWGCYISYPLTSTKQLAVCTWN